MRPDIRTDPALLARLRVGAKRQLTPAEIRAQRISFVASCSDLPRDEIVRIIDRMSGAHRSRTSSIAGASCSEWLA